MSGERSGHSRVRKLVEDLALRTYDRAALVRSARIAENYSLDGQGYLDEDEAMRCVTCGFASRLAGTAVFAWVRVRNDVEPAVVELCEICNAAVGARNRDCARSGPAHLSQAGESDGATPPADLS